MNRLTQFRKTIILSFVFLLELLCFEFLTGMEVVTDAPDAICLWPSLVMAAIDVWFHCQDGTNQLSRDRATGGLAQEGIICRCRGTSSDPPFGLIAFDKETPDLLELVQRCSRDGIDRIIAVALNNTAVTGATLWRLLQAGASDVLAWNSTKNPAAAIAARFQRWRAVEELVNSELVQNSLVGGSRAWVSVLRQVVEVARYTDASMLITGESGTGKELVARLIHTLDARPEKGRLVTLDCTTVVPTLAGSEFFGHERGAFTSAVAARDGAFALADKGTLFLDEVAELPPSLQAELLRVVQEHTYKRVGGNDWKRTDFRLICATNRDLKAEETRGNFRLDFYHRIAAVTVGLPPLRERRGDILPLATHFFQSVSVDLAEKGFDPAVEEFLLTRDYPGNVRELQQLVLRVAKRHVGPGPITVGDIPEDDRGTAIKMTEHDWTQGELEIAVRRALAKGVRLPDLKERTAEVAIEIALRDAQGNVQRAAIKLGVTDRALQLRKAAQRGDMAGGAGPSRRRSGRTQKSWDPGRRSGREGWSANL